MEKQDFSCYLKFFAPPDSPQYHLHAQRIIGESALTRKSCPAFSWSWRIRYPGNSVNPERQGKYFRKERQPRTG